MTNVSTYTQLHGVFSQQPLPFWDGYAEQDLQLSNQPDNDEFGVSETFELYEELEGFNFRDDVAAPVMAGALFLRRGLTLSVCVNDP